MKKLSKEEIRNLIFTIAQDNLDKALETYEKELENIDEEEVENTYGNLLSKYIHEPNILNVRSLAEAIAEVLYIIVNE